MQRPQELKRFMLCLTHPLYGDYLSARPSEATLYTSSLTDHLVAVARIKRRRAVRIARFAGDRAGQTESQRLQQHPQFKP